MKTCLAEHLDSINGPEGPFLIGTTLQQSNPEVNTPNVTKTSNSHPCGETHSVAWVT